MKIFLGECFNEGVGQERFTRNDNLCFMEFNSADVELFASLGVVVDALGPYRVVCMWDDNSALEIGG